MMKTNEFVLITGVLAGLTLGCRDDSSPGGDGGGSSEGSTGPAVGTSTTAADESSGTTGAVGSGSGQGEESSSSGAPPVEVTLEGQVIDFVASAPIPDAQLSVYGDDTITATADAMGMFSIGTFAAEQGALLQLAPTDEHWGAVIPVDVGAEPLQSEVELTQISTAIVDAQIMGLAAQMPTPPDLDQAIIIVRVINNTAVLDGPTTIEMTPGPEDGTYYAPDEMGAPILNQNTIEFSAIPVVVYFNIADTDPGEITFAATHPTRECTVLYPELPTVGRHMTLVDVSCVNP